MIKVKLMYRDGWIEVYWLKKFTNKRPCISLADESDMASYLQTLSVIHLDLSVKMLFSELRKFATVFWHCIIYS